MKNIEFTQEHKSKLLEMCTLLFPDYQIMVHGTNIYLLPTTDYINWFEFCMTHLISKIQIKCDKNYLTSICSSINLSASNNSENEYRWNHPIDYLYEEFKKLK